MSARLLDLPPGDWPGRFEALGAAAYQGASAAHWVLRRGVTDWDSMSDLSAALRRRLAAEEPLRTAQVERRSGASDGALKLLLRYPDGASAEAVGMPGTRGRTVCISTQVGCPVRCSFCASGLEGLERNLTAGEILEQVLVLRQEQGEFHRLVVMGMGDAGFNLDATLAALDALIAPAGGGFSARRITVSTVAPAGALARIAAWGRPVTLALSVHAPDDALRHELVPGVRRRRLEETLEEADRLFAAAGREYTVEYVLLRGVNDAPRQAQALAHLLQGRRCHVNLIPYNPVAGLDYHRPERAAQDAFAEALRRASLSVTLRRSLGGAVDAACGQLRRRALTLS
ncbi:MAG: 23S rRNA (adenine(2503)-C(2))-methyltransferase RlmN [Planctomycetota bacterium]|nr:MAG: 23S rRNA (adenine(2503)-C(2))-methyltransferase RlmN [Planctomycetota bacterium]